MAIPARHHVLTLADYFSAEQRTTDKLEFFDSQIYVMAGGTARHNYLETRILDALARHLVGTPCFTMTSNQRIATPDGLYTYADGSVFCGALEVGPEQTALNPVLLVEVLSDSTRAYDLGEKLRRYQQIPSLEHVLLVEQDERRIVSCRRTRDGWTEEVHEPNGVVRLEAWHAELPIEEIYQGLDRIAGGG